MPHLIKTSLEDISNLKTDLYSEDWETSLKASDTLAKLNRPETISILIVALNSENSWTRNSAALGIRKTNNNSAFRALLDRIKELGPDEEIGTLVYSLETGDCSKYLLNIIDLHFNGNFEVENATTTILNEQEFKLTTEEFEKLKLKLQDHGMTVEDLDIKYKINGA